MKLLLSMITTALLVTLGGLAQADDHHFQAVQSGGLTLGVSGPFLPHGVNGHIPDEAPGRGSPFKAFDPEDLGTPSSRTVRGDEEAGIPPKPHANVKFHKPKV